HHLANAKNKKLAKSEKKIEKKEKPQKKAKKNNLSTKIYQKLTKQKFKKEVNRKSLYYILF
ncbi:MAG: hypothetical protein KMY52_10085, partial [Methanobacterium sp.]|nr:hypothetical protein [Methanobacterium sp.]